MFITILQQQALDATQQLRVWWGRGLIGAPTQRKKSQRKRPTVRTKLLPKALALPRRCRRHRRIDVVVFDLLMGMPLGVSDARCIRGTRDSRMSYARQNTIDDRIRSTTYSSFVNGTFDFCSALHASLNLDMFRGF